MASNTAVRTVYRLSGVAPTTEAMLYALDLELLDRLGADPHLPEALGVPAVYITCGMEHTEAPWCEPMSRSTGITVSESVRRTAAMLLLAVDDTVYAIGCDQGYRLIPDHLKDKRFGLSFAIRQMDPSLIRGAVSRSLGQARTDISLVPGGAPVPLLGIRDHSRIVRSLGGYLDDLPLTRSRYSRGKAVSAQGGCGLRIALGVEPEALLSDLRTITRICREDIPNQELEFVDHIVPVSAPTTLDALDEALDDRLGRPADGSISVCVPSEHHMAYAEATTYMTQINSSNGALRSDDFDLGYVLTRARLAQPGQRLKALREGAVTLARDRRARATDTLAVTSALTWLETGVSLGPRRFFLMDGEWYEAGAAYVEECRAAVRALFSPSPSVSLPSWADGESENTYNNRVADDRPNWLCLDTKNVANPLRPRDQVEICDLLMPDGTLILVKRAGGSGPLSHLFSQARVAVELLQESAQVRADFTAKVARLSGGARLLPTDYTPKRIVLAMLLKKRESLTPDSVFGFSQITIAQTSKALATRGVTVEVVGIPQVGAHSLSPSSCDAGMHAAVPG
ncbi:TIGR04141 family sporadically distributed protein [Streptomyces europaeiscabiei]|uniref:TIGR04141 family sporadically distributed protein n=1 Tax=Streptomyces europaeiscabiei TaxID=146819 RepID=A0ABU4NB03_9ACTN|nr:TIGR04141 family sporadically distributed protein [Streptomyces europaeiscabiei]MDX3542471.1 TIGR04141 family sporadically distributed protein [Streptomyces europaeiscabiei]MDX3550337.1 TIGR04141 family sporadically distributed protein [Streptomyces europaeiscabiei]MDX3699103.1 TIGR04141 family sporadically distributed protein [Streptomyces europaeiscabiei]MDX3841866.1 TIGR04141 family sporadically distributed protein [Streptomyces europaeiscabiei]